MSFGGELGAFGAFSGVWPARFRLFDGIGEWFVAVDVGETGTSSIMMLQSNETRLPRWDRMGRSCPPNRSMDRGAPSRLRPIGVMFSSSAMLGSRSVLVVGLG